MGSGKAGGGSKDYFGHIAGRVCQGQLDFVWGMMINNELVWPKAKLWDTKIYKKNTSLIYTDGNVYKASEKTSVDPNGFPWILLAIPYAAGTYTPGTRRLYLGNVWEVTTTTSSAPPAAVTQAMKEARSVQYPIVTNGWIWVCTPETWVSGSGSNFWAANSIVAWKGRLYTTPTGTKAEPPSAPWVLWKVDRASSPNPLKFTVEDYGDAYLYWGTATQTLDTVNEGILSALGHPPYRNRATLMLKSFRFGTMQVNPPSVTLLGGRSPIQSLITGAATNMDADWNVNPWTVAAEFLTHPVIGLGLPLFWFNQASWQAQADLCAANPSLYYISPLWTSLQSVRAIVADILSYPDGIIFWNTVAELVAAHWPHGEAAPTFNAANTIDRNDFIQELATQSDGWDGTSSSVILSFQDIHAAFKDRPVIAPNLFNLNVTRRMKSEKVERPHITRFSQAVAWATEKAKISGDQTSKGTIPVRAEKASLIEPGSIFLLTDDELATSEAQRCTRKAESLSSGVVKLTHETERGLSPQPYSPTPAAPTTESGPNPAAIRNYAAVQLPSSLADGSPDQLALLAGRMNGHTSALEVWFQNADLTSYSLLASQHGFAVAGSFNFNTFAEVNSLTKDSTTTISSTTQGNTYPLSRKNFHKIEVSYVVNPGHTIVPCIEGTDYIYDSPNGTLTILVGGNIPNGTPTLGVVLYYAMAVLPEASTPAADLERIKSVLTDDEGEDGKLLLFAFQKANPAKFEIMKIFAVASGTTQLGLTIRRQCYGTLYGGDGTHEFTGDDFVFIVFKDDLTVLSHDSFAGLHRVNGTANFLLAPRSAWVDADTADLYDPASNPDGLSTKFSYTFNNIYAPTLIWISQQYDGADITDWGATFDTGKVFKLSFEVQDTNADLAHVAINAVLGQELVTLYSQNFEPSSSQVGVLTFTLPKNGRWKIFVDVLDSSGNQARYFLPSADGSSILINHNNNNSGTPIIYSYDVRGNFIANLIFGYQRTSTTVKWQIKNRGVAHDATGTGGVWTTAPAYGAAVGSTQLYGPVANFQRGTKTLYAFTQHTGDNDSAVIEWNL